MTTYTVGQVATMSGLTVRTLHHYDEIGLLTPSTRRDNGYRLYDEGDLERLRRILVYRELGMSLADIEGIVDADEEPAARLLEERHRVTERIRRLRAVSDMIDGMINAEREGITMTASDNLEVFGDFNPADHEDEARERWGDTEAYAQSARRTAAYTKQDWEAIRAEAAEINDRFLSLMEADVDPDDPLAAAIVDTHRDHVTKWFYDCPPTMHAGLGQLYVQDQRFTDSIDKAGQGLAEYMAAAFAARYDR